MYRRSQRKGVCCFSLVLIYPKQEGTLAFSGPAGDDAWEAAFLPTGANTFLWAREQLFNHKESGDTVL